MGRVAQQGLCIVLLIGSTCYGQSLGDVARENRKQKSENTSAPAKTFSNDDLADEPEAIQLVPGSSSSGEGTLVAPGRGKHHYRVIRLDVSQFPKGGTIHISITMGKGESEASFELYPQGVTLPEEGFPHGLASAWNVGSGSEAKINYHFDHGTVFQFAAEGSWNAKAGTTNTFSFVVDVEGPRKP
jgi:hypothetical protein